ncbi:hypothetical protein PAPYR_9131 [Paratrimastix pyriformis]|uniref:Uncharacterized protein n=1 Tax=Paratrimastix pyriformis TaxID=342808 RepID=A0ABQ8U8V6_9EUKA|nr:hypothetical protein PAPYR_11049 [Paratrimastix pyriformis]KAJ4455837.1 hypothetical protein PAPYR_9131 [Paratrimastix pyriformis]
MLRSLTGAVLYQPPKPKIVGAGGRKVKPSRFNPLDLAAPKRPQGNRTHHDGGAYGRVVAASKRFDTAARLYYQAAWTPDQEVTRREVERELIARTMALARAQKRAEAPPRYPPEVRQQMSAAYHRVYDSTKDKAAAMRAMQEISRAYWTAQRHGMEPDAYRKYRAEERKRAKQAERAKTAPLRAQRSAALRAYDAQVDQLKKRYSELYSQPGKTDIEKRAIYKEYMERRKAIGPNPRARRPTTVQNYLRGTYSQYTSGDKQKFAQNALDEEAMLAAQYGAALRAQPARTVVVGDATATPSRSSWPSLLSVGPAPSVANLPIIRADDWEELASLPAAPGRARRAMPRLVTPPPPPIPPIPMAPPRPRYTYKGRNIDLDDD